MANNANKTRREGRSEKELLNEIYGLQKELNRLGRTDIRLSVERFRGRPYAELLDEIKYLHSQIVEAKRPKPRRKTGKKKEETAGKDIIKLNSGNIRNAVILSEILGSPLSKRANKPMYSRTIRG